MKKSKIKISNHELLNNLDEGLKRLGESASDDFATNLAIGKNQSNIEIIGKAFNKSLISLRNKYCKKDDNGQPMVKAMENGAVMLQFNSPKDAQLYNDSYEKLLEQENEVELYKIKTSVLKKMKDTNGSNLSPNTLFKLKSIIEDDLKLLS